MSSYRQILYHIIFRTKGSQKTMSQQHIKEFLAYTLGIIQAQKGFLYRINAMEDHVHILSDLHPDIALSHFIRNIKVATSLWLKQNENFPDFAGWAEGYAAITYSHSDKDTIVNYIKNQQEHHRKISFNEELERILIEQGIIPDKRYFP
ncbi:MAG: IS200/IS605 family transposase [Ignavibacteriales bacterium]|nr:IS200/IS605 family transposase [Ignavibacteriales bacterium]